MLDLIRGKQMLQTGTFLDSQHGTVNNEALGVKILSRDKLLAKAE